MQLKCYTSVNADEAVDHDKHGTKTKGFGQFVAANEAIYWMIWKIYYKIICVITINCEVIA